MEHTKPLSYVQALKRLSPRECQILDMVAQEKANKEIANQLHLSIRTIESHRTNICQRIGINGRGALEKWIREQPNSA